MTGPTLLTPDNRAIPTRFSRGLKARWGYYDTEKQEIVLWSGLKGEQLLEYAIHEATHAMENKWDEEAVDKFAKALAAYLMELMEKVLND